MRRISVEWVLVCAALCTAVDARAVTLVEATFDDGPDGSGRADGRASVNNLEGRSAATLELEGAAHRSTLGEGRYGRALVLGGGSDALRLTDVLVPPSSEGLLIMLWIAPESSGWILQHAGSWGLFLNSGAVELAIANSAGGFDFQPTGATIPGDGQFHHLTGWWDFQTLGFAVDVDFGQTGSIASVPLPTASSGAVRMGVELSARIDELVIANTLPGSSQLFDRDPKFCGYAGYACIEETFTLSPVVRPPGVASDYGFEVPVRFKTVYDPAQCSAATPCPLAIDISGGFACADDYDIPGQVEAIAAAGLVVVTIDPYCEARGWSAPIVEPPQYVAVKDWVTKNGAAAARIAPGAYVASGCSHGAGTVFEWMVAEDDYPARTYARSAGLAPHCGYHHGGMCQDYRSAIDQVIASALGSAPGVHDDDDPALRQAFGPLDPARLGTIVETRELALSWGADLSPESAVCRADGTTACFEEGAGATYGNRYVRDVWQSFEGATPTGYFVEDHAADCQHCASQDSPAFACGVCFLKHGRAGMPSACPDCLALDSGPPSGGCPTEEAWTDGGVAGADAGDGGPAASSDDSDAGCGCAVAPVSSPLRIGLVMAAALVLARRRRRCPGVARRHGAAGASRRGFSALGR